MSDHAAFLKAIITHPDDDGPRLVYADWLDERGDPRGEFIRVQCEWAATPRYLKKGARVSHKEFAALRRSGARKFRFVDNHEARTVEVTEDGFPNSKWLSLRSRSLALLKAHGNDWVMPVVAIVGVGYEFRRGFVEEVTCTAAHWLGGRCGACGGDGHYDWSSDDGMSGRDECAKCHGDGRLPGHAAALRAVTPLRTVLILDPENLPPLRFMMPVLGLSNEVVVNFEGRDAHLGLVGGAPILGLRVRLLKVRADLLAAEFRGLAFDLLDREGR